MTRNKSQKKRQRGRLQLLFEKMTVRNFILLVFVVWIIDLLYIATKKTIENDYLDKHGIEVKAIITRVKGVGSKGTIRCTYEFKSYGNVYAGWVDSDTLHVGDSIDVLYRKDNPEINRSEKFLKNR